MSPSVKIALLPSILFAGLTACSGQEAQPGTQATGEAMVAAADRRAAAAGLEIMAEGGTAVDAAIAVQAVLGLVEPQSSGIAGGAFMMVYDAKTKRVRMYDGRETAPASATPKLFYGDNDKRLPYIQGIASGKSTGVPGVVAMLHMAHEDYGKTPWARAFDRAIDYADEGFVVSPRLESSLARFAGYGILAQNENAQNYFFTDGKTLPAGFVRDNKPYADSLRSIAQDYRNMYRGPIAEAIIEASRLAPRPGGLTLQDFADYEPRQRDALCSGYKGMAICGAQPPSSGGVAVQAIMRTLANTDIADFGPDDAQGWHLFIEASRLSYADRDLYVGDDDFVDVPTGPMLDQSYLKSRAALISADKAMPSVKAGDPAGFKPGTDMTPDSPGTSHFSIVDPYGNAVSMTTTVEGGFGSQRMAAGMMLNNQLTDFSFEPLDKAGNPIANAVAAGKRPRSSMSPTIVLDKNGDFLLATGSPGGNSIIAYTAKTLVGMLDWDLSPQAAADLPNVIARGNRVKMEKDGMPEAVIERLQVMGHNLALSDGEISGIHIIAKMPDGKLVGAADKRREGVAWTTGDIPDDMK